MRYIIYFIIAICATTLGSLTGVGGGVIIKPLLDVFNDFNVETISVISSLTVLSMSIISITKHIYAKTQIPFNLVIPLSFGSTIGGYIGQNLLKFVIKIFESQNVILVIQNLCLTILIFGAFIYMHNKDNISGKHLKSTTVSLFVGIFLGSCSSFLGIGGGPINVALLIYLYSMSTKTATVCSLIIILFSQVSKLVTIAIITGFSIYDLSIAPIMISGAVIGGYIGVELNKRFSEKKVCKSFQIVQLAVLGITIFNVIRNL